MKTPRSREPAGRLFICMRASKLASMRLIVFMDREKTVTETARSGRWRALLDCALLGAVVLVSSLPYVGGLGFYNDDWYSIAGFSHQGLLAMTREMLAPDSDMRLRPVQIIYQTVSYALSGQNPLGYHLSAIVLLAAAAISVYLAARAATKLRTLPLAIALVFAVLPQYSTDRFWMSSQQAVLSVIFAMAGLVALERATAPDARNTWRWAAGASMCFLLSLLSYEITLGLIGCAIVLAGWRMVRNGRQNAASRLWGTLALGGAAAVCDSAIVADRRSSATGGKHDHAGRILQVFRPGHRVRDRVGRDRGRSGCAAQRRDLWQRADAEFGVRPKRCVDAGL